MPSGQKIWTASPGVVGSTNGGHEANAGAPPVALRSAPLKTVPTTAHRCQARIASGELSLTLGYDAACRRRQPAAAHGPVRRARSPHDGTGGTDMIMRITWGKLRAGS